MSMFSTVVKININALYREMAGYRKLRVRKFRGLKIWIAAN